MSTFTYTQRFFFKNKFNECRLSSDMCHVLRQMTNVVNSIYIWSRKKSVRFFLLSKCHMWAVSTIQRRVVDWQWKSCRHCWSLWYVFRYNYIVYLRKFDKYTRAPSTLISLNSWANTTKIKLNWTFVLNL